MTEVQEASLVLLTLCTSLGILPAEGRTYQTDYTKYETYIQPTVLMNVFRAGEYYENVNKDL